MAVPQYFDGDELFGADLNALVALLPTIRTQRQDVTVSNSTAQAPITDLVAPLAASSIYTARAVLWYSSTTTADFAPGLTVPAGATYRVCPHGSPSTDNGLASAQMWVGTFTSAPIGTFGGKGAGAGNAAMLVLEATITTGATAGNLQLTFGQGLAEVSNTVVHATSSLTLQRVA